jgi:hypothetical protein
MIEVPLVFQSKRSAVDGGSSPSLGVLFALEVVEFASFCEFAMLLARYTQFLYPDQTLQFRVCRIQIDVFVLRYVVGFNSIHFCPSNHDMDSILLAKPKYLLKHS